MKRIINYLFIITFGLAISGNSNIISLADGSSTSDNAWNQTYSDSENALYAYYLANADTILFNGKTAAENIAASGGESTVSRTADADDYEYGYGQSYSHAGFLNNNDNEYEDKELSDKDLYKLLTGSYNAKLDESRNISEEETLEKVVDYVNILRSKKGLSELVMDDDLMEAASIRAEELTEKYSHTRPDGEDCLSIIDEMGNEDEDAGENIARGQYSAMRVVNEWYHSNGHRANMMYSKFKRIGVGMYNSGGTKYWVQIFTE